MSCLVFFLFAFAYCTDVPAEQGPGARALDVLALPETTVPMVSAAAHLDPTVRHALEAAAGCWIFPPEAEAVAVTLQLEMSRDGRPRTDSIRLARASSGEGPALDAAFRAARRAILRCAAGGYDLAPDTYDSWRFVEITFDPAVPRAR